MWPRLCPPYHGPHLAGRGMSLAESSVAIQGPWVVCAATQESPGSPPVRHETGSYSINQPCLNDLQVGPLRLCILIQPIVDPHCLLSNPGVHDFVEFRVRRTEPVASFGMERFIVSHNTWMDPITRGFLITKYKCIDTFWIEARALARVHIKHLVNNSVESLK